MSESLLAIVMRLTLALMAPDATLLFAGDAMQHQSQLDAARIAQGIYDFSTCFEPIRPLVESADYAVVNLETPLGTSGYTGYPCFNAPVEYAKALRDAGFDLFLTANNHTLDRRDRGLRHTVATLDSLGVAHLGTYADASQRSQRLPLIVDIKGFKIGFLNYTYGTNGIDIQGDVVVDYINKPTIKNDIDSLRGAGAEIIVVAPHWGNEYQLREARSQRDLAQWLLDQDVDIVMGGHPHVVQPMKMVTDSLSGRNRLIVYSLGNFISGMKTRDTRGGAVAVVKLARDSLGVARIADAHYELVYSVPPTHGAPKPTSSQSVNTSATSCWVPSYNYRVMPIDSVPAAWREPAADFRRALESAHSCSY